MTSLMTVYEAFLAKMLDDEWAGWTQDEIEADWRALLDGALPRFKFPRQSLKIVDDSFESDLTNIEIQILANYMKCEWLNRAILTWEHVKPLYEEKDFSEANLISKLKDLLAHEQIEARKLEAIYYRSIDSKPYDYTQFAGDNDIR